MVAFVLVLLSLAFSGEGDAGYTGFYDLVNGGENQSGWVQIQGDGTWSLVVSSSTGISPTDMRGQFAVVSGEDGCAWFEFWSAGPPGRSVRSSLCDGVLTTAGYSSVFLRRTELSAFHEFCLKHGGVIKATALVALLALLTLWKVESCGLDPSIRHGSEWRVKATGGTSGSKS